MTSYPDAYDARNAKAGSDHDRAEAWRIIALEERRRADFYLAYATHDTVRHGMAKMWHACSNFERRQP